MMTLREWLDSNPRGKLTTMAHATGYARETLTKIANNVTRPHLFTTQVITEYTKGVVCFSEDRVRRSVYRIIKNGVYWNVFYRSKYIASCKTQEAAQAWADACTRELLS